MSRKIKKIFTNVRVIILLIALVLAITAIHPNPWAEGVAIRSVTLNSSASLADIQNPKPNVQPMSRERILSIENDPISGPEDYYDAISKLEPNTTIQLKTNNGLYKLTTREKITIIELNETETRTVQETAQVNESGFLANKTINKTITVPKTKSVHEGLEDIGLRIYQTPTSNIRQGLDLQGGTRVLLQPEKEISNEEIDTLIESMKERLNVYGLSDLTVRSAGDLSGNQYILVEIAGANEEEVKELLAKQGKFEAKIGNQTVFIGGQDIKYVCRSADCAGIDPNQGCGQSQNQWFCRFRFSISVSKEAAERQGDLTRNLEVITEDKNQYLSEKLLLFLDDKQVDELSIGAELKGKTDVTDIQISGSGVGANQQQAAFEALKNMKRLQTILITGSLPVKLNIIKTDSISPVLGQEFIKNALFVGMLAIVVVSLILFIRYKRLKIAAPICLTLVSEIVMILGVAALIGWNIDLASIAGIIIVIGTGVDNLIVITDETLRGETKTIFNWKERLKGAFFIIMGSYSTIFVAMLPLVFAGAGLLKGFAITTIIGASIGVFLVRPTYAAVVEILLKE